MCPVARTTPADRLPRKWRHAVRDAGATAGPERVAAEGGRLIGRWAEPHRHYHDLDHLTAVLDALEVLAAPGPAPAPVRLAAWFHDAVYRGVPGTDEEASAALAERVLGGLGVPPGPVAEVARLVRLTVEHRVDDDDALGALLVDADLAVLAAPPAGYLRYAAAVRREYAHLPDAEFTAGRIAVLQSLLDRPALFRTVPGRLLWDAAARVNLAEELARLRGSAGDG